MRTPDREAKERILSRKHGVYHHLARPSRSRQARPGDEVPGTDPVLPTGTPLPTTPFIRIGHTQNVVSWTRESSEHRERKTLRLVSGKLSFFRPQSVHELTPVGGTLPLAGLAWSPVGGMLSLVGLPCRACNLNLKLLQVLKPQDKNRHRRPSSRAQDRPARQGTRESCRPNSLNDLVGPVIILGEKDLSRLPKRPGRTSYRCSRSRICSLVVPRPDLAH